MAILACGGCLKDLFVTEEEIIDRFTGQELWLWGNGNFGRIGNDLVAVSMSSPVQTISKGTDWKCVSLGFLFSGGVKTDGTLWMWGCGYSGALGNNFTSCVSSPVQTISAGTTWRNISTGNYHTAAVKTDGTLWTWGCGLRGQLGNNSNVNRSSPVQVAGNNWNLISLGFNTSAAIKTDGTLWTWGCGNSGRLGTTAVNRSSPVQTVSGGTNWKYVSVGSSHMFAVKTDGTLWGWGAANQGQLGNNSTITRSSPVQTVSGGTNWKYVAVGSATSAAIKTDGTLWLWGYGNAGQLGNNCSGFLYLLGSPVQTVSGGNNWRSVNLGFCTTAAIKTDGSLWLWGNGFQGMLGDNTAIAKSSPVQTITGGTNWRSASIVDQTSSALRLTEY